MKFNHLNVPDQWQHYWTKYPEGYTIMEALISWVSQVDGMVDNVNDWNTYLEKFVEQFDTELQNTLIGVLNDWNDSGFLAELINEYTNERIDDMELSISNLSNAKVDKSGVGQVSWANLSQEAKENISSGTTAIVGDDSVYSGAIINGAVTPLKTDFLNPEQTTNLWNVDSLASGQINRLDGTILTNDNFSYTDYYINTTGQTVATVSYPTTATPYVITYAFYTDMDPSTYISGENLPSNLTIQIPSTANYMRMSARHDTNDITKLQVNFGSVALPLETPTYAADERITVGSDNIKDNTITSDKLASVDADKLSIIDFLDNQPTEDYQYIPYGNYRISANDGKIWTANGSISGSELTTQYTATGRIPVVAGQTYRAKARNYIIFDSNNKVIQFIENSALVYREITIAENGATMALSPLVVEATSQFGLTRITPLVSEKLFTIPNLQNSQSRFNGKNAALFGDSITGNNPQIADVLSNRLGFTTLNMAIGGAKMAERNDTTETAGGGHTANSGVRIAEAIISGDFSTQYEYTNAQYSGGTLTRILDTLELLENTDFSTIDYATVQFGANDYLQGVPIGTISGNRYTYMGAYRIFLDTLLETYPNIKPLLVSTPMIFDEPPKGIEMSEYVQATKEVANYFNLPYLDNFTNAGINNYNRYEFFGPTDGVHPNIAGLTHLGNRIASGFELNY